MASIALEDAYEIIEKQEESLRFESFDNKDAWELGKVMVELMQKRGLELSICIRKLNGYIVFQYAQEGTSLTNQMWMQRKFNTVRLLERSSLGAWAEMQFKHETLAIHQLDEKDYALCGGGFPLRVKSGPISMVLTVSGLPDVQDHNFMVSALREFLSMPEVPELPEEIARL